MTRTRQAICLTAATLVAAAVVALTVPATDTYRAWQAEQVYHSGDGGAKRNALRQLAKLDTPRSRRVIRQALADPMPIARAAAADAIFTARYADLADDLAHAAQTETDPNARARMVVASTQLTDDPAWSRLTDLAQSTDPDVRLAAARALLRHGRIDAADQLFAFALDHDRFRRRYAQRELLTFARPMGEMIGQPIPLPASVSGRWSRQEIDALQSWWKTHATPRLLQDFLAWCYNRSASWSKVRQLLDNWHQRAPGFLRSADDQNDD